MTLKWNQESTAMVMRRWATKTTPSKKTSGHLGRPHWSWSDPNKDLRGRSGVKFLKSSIPKSSVSAIHFMFNNKSTCGYL